MEETSNQKENKRMNPDEIAALLSHTMKDVAEKKTTTRYAMAVSRIAVALAKVIEVVDLKDRVEFIEQALKKRKQK